MKTGISFCSRKYVPGTYESKGLIAAAEFGTISSTDERWVVTSEGRLCIDLPGVTVQLVATVAWRIVIVSLDGHRRVQTSQMLTLSTIFDAKEIVICALKSHTDQ